MDAKVVSVGETAAAPHVDSSYQLGTFRDNVGALHRLKRQASVAIDMEFDHLQEAGLRSGLRILDIGCGPGIIASEIALRTQPKRLIAADCNETSLAETRKLFERLGMKNAEVRKANVYDNSASGIGEVDFIYSRFVFQHLSDPLGALANLRGFLADQGRLCLCDIDDRWLNVVPEIPEFNSFIQRVGKAQAQRGGDRLVGTKMAHYLKKAGYKNIRSTVLMLTTDVIGKDTFCDLVFGYKLEVVPEAELDIASKELERIKQSIYSEDGWASVAAIFVSGQR